MWKSACLGLCGLALSAAPAMALDTKLSASCKPVKPEIDISKIERKIQLPQESTYKAMQKAQDPIGREAYDEALAILLPVIERNEDRAYDNAWVRTQVSFIYASKKQWNKAIEHSRAALSKNILSATQELQIRNNMMYFYLAAENYAKALEAALEYFKYAPSPTADNLALLASVYFEAGKKREAVCPLHQAINMSKDVKKSWYDFFYSLHAELQDFEGATTVLMEALPKYPDTKIYWQQLPQLLLRLSRDTEALAIMELADKQGMLEKESEFKNLSALYSQFEAPYKSAETLQQAVKEGKVKADEKIWKQIGQNWSLAREYRKAIEAYGEAAKFANDGTYFQYQGEIHSELENWKEASTAFNSALDKGGLKDPGRVYLNLGIAQYNSGNTNAALSTLEKATKYEKTRGHAAQWIQFINMKIAAR
ncbi:hypothetical protein [Permianibacter aggregans]|uniref:Uncharacterized protein n=1 Tax=Permianibacter aggregans TaxID=1510150 RepID=A0A4R6UMM8_9GAMM|nr:hypothetical protein [Permianibacter aggregans]QGX38935.1 hypothetical protein E2H98_04335 [Permianibacter aggregans]TDQ46819.1 hypothetical protein EV696_11281 [Permianibacter aggregans]